MKKQVVACLMGAGLLVGCGERDYGGVDSHEEVIEEGREDRMREQTEERRETPADLELEEEPNAQPGQQGYDQGSEIPQQ